MADAAKGKKRPQLAVAKRWHAGSYFLVVRWGCGGQAIVLPLGRFLVRASHRMLFTCNEWSEFSRARRELVGMTKSRSRLTNSDRDRERRPRAGELASWPPGGRPCFFPRAADTASPASALCALVRCLAWQRSRDKASRSEGGPPLRADLFRRTPPSVEINPQPSLRWTLFPFKSSCPSSSPATTAKHAFDIPRYLRHPQPTEPPTEHSLITSTHTNMVRLFSCHELPREPRG
jgi:hypothetical protein